jgi:hypothetical protein
LKSNDYIMFEKLRLKRAEISIEKEKKKLVIATDENINYSQHSIDEISKILIDFKKHKYTKHDSFLNLCVFSDIIAIDLTLLLERVRLAKRIQEKKLYARVIALTIVDYLDNIGVLIGRDCLLELKNNNMTEFIEEFKSINKKFSNFKKDNDGVLREIRNNTIAHKSKNALKLNDHINKIDFEEIHDFGLELKEYSREFVELSSKVLTYIVEYMKEGRKI